MVEPPKKALPGSAAQSPEILRQGPCIDSYIRQSYW